MKFAALFFCLVAWSQPCNAFVSPHGHIGRLQVNHGTLSKTGVAEPSYSTNSLSNAESQSLPRSKTNLSLVSSATAVRLAETVAPKLGIFTALLLFLAPAAAVRDTVQSNQLCDLNPLPIALMSVVTTSWLAYGLAIQDFYVALSNLPGALLSLSYVIGILPVMQVAHSGTAGRSANRRELRAVQILLALGATSSLTLWTALRFSGAPLATAKTVLGLFASTFTVMLFGSPLSTVRTVVKQRNSASILGSLTVAQIINSSLWTAYGVTLRQIFVWAPNGIGLVLGLMQLALKFLYPSDPVCEIPDDDDISDTIGGQTAPLEEVGRVQS